MCHLFFEQKQPENKEIPCVRASLWFQFNTIPAMTSAVSVFRIIHTLHEASIEISLGRAVTLHGVHAQDARCSTVLLHLCVDGSQRCTCTLIPSTTAFSDPHLQRLSTFQVPYLNHIFHFLSHTKASLKV